jgi:RNA polymerase sigma-70 factor (ECF subfamily)
MLTVLETLGPAERAVFVLREVFDTSYDEIAAVVDKSPAAVRQIAHRARAYVAARRPRMAVDPAAHRTVIEKFVAAISTGDVQGLMDVLAPDIVVIADGGGVVPAVRTPISGAEKVARLLAHASEAPGFAATVAWINATPGVRFDFDAATAAVSLVVERGRITRIFAIINPHKLGSLKQVVELRR